MVRPERVKFCSRGPTCLKRGHAIQARVAQITSLPGPRDPVYVKPFVAQDTPPHVDAVALSFETCNVSGWKSS
eukprot:387363-Pyramimonas_sp.AAC.1